VHIFLQKICRMCKVPHYSLHRCLSIQLADEASQIDHGTQERTCEVKFVRVHGSYLCGLP
jgi:hypothetical protein